MRSVILLIAVGALVGCRKQPVFFDLEATCTGLQLGQPWTRHVKWLDTQIYFCDQPAKHHAIEGPVQVLRTAKLGPNGASDTWNTLRPYLENALVEEGWCQEGGVYNLRAAHQQEEPEHWCTLVQELR